MSFQDTGLHPQLLRAIAKRGFTQPAPVQSECIPKILEGKDVVARARTGSGKTLAYLLPALHRIISNLASSSQAAASLPSGWQILVLVPTRELCDQVRSEALAITQHCGMDIGVAALTSDSSTPSASAHMVVATPGRVAGALRSGQLAGTTIANSLQMLILDEADLLLSYGYEEDLQLLAPQVPRSCQCVLMSATVSEDIERLQKLVLHNPTTLNLLDLGSSLAAGSGTAQEILHFQLQVAPCDKLLAAMALLKLGLVRKKVLLFVNSVDCGYRLKLFLESFGIRAALLNAELPLNSRSHILETFNKGLFDYLVATDDVHSSSHDKQQQEAQQEERPAKRAKRSKKGSKAGPSKDEEFGVTRGIDFKGVDTIINFDLPSSLQGYVHRVGRTGRAGRSGAAISLFTPGDEDFRQQLELHLADKRQEQQEQHLAAVPVQQQEEGQQQEQVLKPFHRLTKAALDALRYRGEDIARSITKHVIAEARTKELRLELLNSDRLKEYFEEHEAERQLLRHDKALHKVQPPAHLKHIPAYLKDATAVGGKSQTGNKGKGIVPVRKRHFKAQKKDPLKGIGFMKAPKRGGDPDQELTEMEKKVLATKVKKNKSGVQPVFKQNVRKRHR